MLGPEQSATLVDALEPPDGYRLDIAVGTSFTLDLHALLAVPTAFALSQSASDDRRDGSTPLELLEALRAHAGAITVFTDAAHIKLPTSGAGVLGFLEPSVVPVTAPGGGAFHPKVWAVRFTDDDGANHHRLLVASRNLTFDRSWDTLVRLDEEPTGARVGGVGRFLSDLDQLSVAPLPEDRQAAVEDLATTIDTAQFALPDGFHDVTFHALGVPRPGPRWPYPNLASRTLVVSPFLAAGALDRIARASSNLTVVSRADELDRAYAATAARPPAYEINSDVIDLPEDSGDLAGLHAKIVVVDVPSEPSRVFVGSANMTTAAHHSNVEALLELSGPRYRVGVAKWLDESQPSLRTLLRPHNWAEPKDAETETERVLDRVRRELADRVITCAVRETDSGFRAHYTGDLPALAGARMLVRALSEASWTEVDGDRLDYTKTSDLTGLTGFLGVKLTLGTEHVEFAIACDVHGAPQDREDRLLAALIASPERLVRYLLMLLTDQPEDRFDPVVQAMVRSADRAGNNLEAVPLLETMLRTASRTPQRLAAVSRLMDVVRRSEQLRDDALLDLWDNVVTMTRTGSA